MTPKFSHATYIIVAISIIPDHLSLFVEFMDMVHVQLAIAMASFSQLTLKLSVNLASCSIPISLSQNLYTKQLAKQSAEYIIGNYWEDENNTIL